MSDAYERLKLSNQLCFPLYAAAKEVVKHYRPYLEELDLTYTQYIAMMVLWEEREITVKDLGERLYLDSGTLTPLLKKLEHKGYLTRVRSQTDERSVLLALTPEGEALRDRAVDVPVKLASCVHLTPQDAQQLYRLLYQLLASMDN